MAEDDRERSIAPTRAAEPTDDRLTLDDVKRVAALARLALTDEETLTFLPQLNEVLGYARQVQRLDTTNVAPTSHVLSRDPIDRPDVVGPSLSAEDTVGSAPDGDLPARLFKVPRVI